MLSKKIKKENSKKQIWKEEKIFVKNAEEEKRSIQMGYIYVIIAEKQRNAMFVESLVMDIIVLNAKEIIIINPFQETEAE